MRLYGGFICALSADNRYIAKPLTTTAPSEDKARSAAYSAALKAFPVASGWRQHSAGVSEATQSQIDSIMAAELLKGLGRK
jgi:hypothetical protein